MITNRVGAMTLRTSGQPVEAAGPSEKGAATMRVMTLITSSTRNAPNVLTS